MAVEARIWLDLHGHGDQLDAFLDDLAEFVASRGFTSREFCRSIIISGQADGAEDWTHRTMSERPWEWVVLPGNLQNPDLKLLNEL